MALYRDKKQASGGWHALEGRGLLESGCNHALSGRATRDVIYIYINLTVNRRRTLTTLLTLSGYCPSRDAPTSSRTCFRNESISEPVMMRMVQ
jgi:hypothetical protein